VFQVFENIDREHGRAWQQRAAPKDNQKPVYNERREERQRPPGAERVKNYRAILGYLYTLEEFREQTEKYTGVPCNFPKPEASRTRNGRDGGPHATIRMIVISKGLGTKRHEI